MIQHSLHIYPIELKAGSEERSAYHLYEEPTVVKFKKTEIRMAGARAWERKE